MNERQIQLGLYHHQLSHNMEIVAPNYTPVEWWECDVWAVTPYGYAVEYEIKTSVADFKSDAKKSKSYKALNDEGTSYGTHCMRKYDQLAMGDPNGPSRFFYCIPIELLDSIKDLLPSWAGLYTFQNYPYDTPFPAPIRHRPAQNLHRHKVSQRNLQDCAKLLTFRYWQTTTRVNAILTGGDL